ncbi:MAG TPA: hypothetical protein VGX68_17010 [Thermoanaerobaculia bacterium]|jgi:hypothetical protein|nr:hypothetical protein [Thermoanaerobaculia bacterium]
MRLRTCLPCLPLLLALALSGCGGGNADTTHPVAATPPPREPGSGGTVRAEMKGVDLRIDPSTVMEVRWLRGELVATEKGKPPWFDDPSTFQVKIDAGEIALSPASMSALMNNYVFNYPKAPVSNIKIEIHDGKLRQSATLNKKIKIETTLEGDLSATPDGDIRLHPTSIKAGDLPVKGLLNLLDIELSEMIDTVKARGVRIDENDLILDPERVTPPPRIVGRVTAVRIEGDRIVQIFGGGAEKASLKPPFPKADHYMFYRGGELSFGKLTMHGADLQIIDADSTDPFNFYLAQYSRQLVAGYSRTLSDKGLVVFMPDFDQTGEEKLAAK